MDNTEDFVLKSDTGSETSKWRALYFLNLYRYVLATIFISVVTLDRSPNVFGSYDSEMFFSVSSVYLLITIFHAFTIHWKKPSFGTQVYFQVILDIVIIVLLMHASGSIQSGLGTLLIVTIAGANLLFARRNSILLAAIASISILLEQSYIVIYDLPININFSQAGILGTALFATAFIAQFLVKRIQETEALALQRGVDLEKMEVLADYVVQRMQTGIIVVDQELQIRLINDSAKHLLNLDPKQPYGALVDLSPELVAQLHKSKINKEATQQIIRPTTNAAEVMPRFAELSKNNKVSGTLIFLENIAALAQQAQQLKLASLGRLTASIAHEIRNPLGAISHAAQLLSESNNLDQEESRMVQIIIDHSRRMNAIIENVLQLSRRQASRPQEILLNNWLSNFIDEFSHTHSIDRRIFFYETADEFKVIFDPSQLQQILWNLCGNALRYTQMQSNGIGITIKAYHQSASGIPMMEIIDYGPGIADEHIENIFEPFFTTDTKGTGLGLYIARELCESNQARLSYLKTSDNLSCFRITFADTRRTQAN